MYSENAEALNKHLPNLSSEEKDRIRNGAFVEVCKERRQGWSGELPFFVFWCPECDDFSYDYKHGYPRNQHFNCHKCRAHVDCSPWWAELSLIWESMKIGFFMRMRSK